MTQAEAAREKVEPDRVPRRLILISMVSLAATVVLILWGVWAFQSYFVRVREGPATLDLSGFQSKEHWLAQREQLKEIRRQEDEVLTSYGWVDRENGIARIPIQRAIEIMAARRAAAEAHP